MQTAIVIIIVVAAAFYLIRRFYNSVKKSTSTQPTCGCSCDGCSPALKDNCTEMENKTR